MDASHGLTGRLASRARLASLIRHFFATRGVLEVLTPVRVPTVAIEAQIKPIHADGAYLRTSPELAHKRLLAAGSGPIYELGPVFRAGELGPLHREEFLLLEWYRPGYGLDALIDELIELVGTVADGFGRPVPVKARISYRELFLVHTGLDPLTATLKQLLAAVDGRGPASGFDHRTQVLDWLLSFVIQPRLAGQGLLIVDRFPPDQAALARLGDDGCALRFELYWNSVELANGYDELTDPEEQRARFNRDAQQLAAAGAVAPPIDEHFLASLATMPRCCGVAVGAERLLMCVQGNSALAEAIV